MSDDADELSRLRQRLAEAERRAALIEQLRSAEELSTVARLASTIAHELGTPLNIISGRAMMIASGEIEGEERTNSAKAVVEQANKMAAIIRQILAYLREPTPQKSSVPLAEAVEQALLVVGPLARKREVTLRMDPDSAPLLLQLEPNKLLQLLVFFATRGIRVSPPKGTVTIGSRRESASKESAKKEETAGASSSAPRAQEYFALSFTDQGPAIPKEALASMFKPFFQNERDQDGTALGMSIVHGIVRELGGWLTAESRPSGGATFKVCLPDSVARAAVS